MLVLYVGEQVMFDEKTSKLVKIKGTRLELEHSLVSISKWESIYHKPFMDDTPKTQEESIEYVKCMTLNEVDNSIYSKLTANDLKKISDYIDDPMTATTFGKGGEQNGINHEIITSEIIYYWMVASQIPFECQYWHLRRLLTLIRVCGIKNQPEKKMSTKDTRAHYAALNKARRAKYGKH